MPSQLGMLKPLMQVLEGVGEGDVMGVVVICFHFMQYSYEMLLSSLPCSHMKSIM